MAMKNTILKKAIICIALLLSLIDITQGENSYSIPVSCTIPAIPGVNAPSIEVAEKQNEPAVEKDITTNNNVIYEQTVRKDDNGQIIIVKTIYGK